MSASRNAPFGVRLLSLLLYAAAFIDVIGGVVLIFQSNDDNTFDAADATSGQVATYGVVAVVFGIVSGRFDLSPTSRAFKAAPVEDS